MNLTCKHCGKVLHNIDPRMYIVHCSGCGAQAVKWADGNGWNWHKPKGGVGLLREYEKNRKEP